jgi:6-phosphogluconolactonase (cycloisomerase 2 family)
MRMKFNKSRQLVLVSAASLLAATLVTACSQFTQTLTVDFVYVASNKAEGPNQYGEIDVFEINSMSGKMRQIPTSPFPSGGRNPVAEVVSSDNLNLFVANRDDNSIVQFTIGTDGKLYAYATFNTPGIFPIGLAMNKSNLFVIDTFQPLPICSPASPCTGSIAVYPVTAATTNTPLTISTPATNPSGSGKYWPLTLGSSTDIITPTAVNVIASGAFVYVTAYDTTQTPTVGYIYAFSVGAGGVLTPVAGSPFAAGTHPSAIASDSTSAHVYVTDAAKGVVLSYAVASNGALVPATSGIGGSNQFAAGAQPSAIVVNQAYPYAYVANALDSTVTAYSVNNGALTRVGIYTTGAQPVAIGIDPSTARFLYTANFLGNTVSGWQLNKADGTLLISQFSPYASDANPTAVAAIPHDGTGGGIQ